MTNTNPSGCYRVTFVTRTGVQTAIVGGLEAAERLARSMRGTIASADVVVPTTTVTNLPARGSEYDTMSNGALMDRLLLGTAEASTPKSRKGWMPIVHEM